MPLRRLMLLLFLLAGGTACAAPASPDPAKALDQRIDAAQAAGFRGSIVVADGEGIVYARNVGENLDDRTHFNLASTGKVIRRRATCCGSIAH